MAKDRKEHNQAKYKEVLVTYPQKEIFEKRSFSSDDSKNLYSLNKALDKTNKNLEQNWSKESLIQEFRDEKIELHYRVNELPLIEEINDTTYKKGYGVIGKTIGYDLSVYSGFINLYDADSSNKYLDYLVNPNQEDFEGIRSICIWHDYGQSEFIVADKTVEFVFGDDSYSFQDLEFILAQVETTSLLSRSPPEKALKPTIEELYVDKSRFNFWLDGQLFKLHKEEIDQRFESALSDYPKLDKLSYTGLYFEEERISQLSESLDECLTYFKIERRNTIGCLDFWLMSVHPILITHSIRYLEFLFQKDQKDFSEVKQSILDGDLDEIDQIEAFSLLDAKEVFDLICLCWKPIKESEYYMLDINESILEIIKDLSKTTVRYRINDFENDNNKLLNENKKLHQINKIADDKYTELKKAKGEEIVNEYVTSKLKDSTSNTKEHEQENKETLNPPDFSGARKPESDVKNFIIDSIEKYHSLENKLPENYKKLKFWLISKKQEMTLYTILTDNPLKPLEVEHFNTQSDLEFSRTFNSVLQFLINSDNKQ